MTNWLNFLAPVNEKTENPAWFYRWGRLIMAATLFMLPLLYDSAVPEVGADARWYMMQLVFLLMTTLFFASRVYAGGFQLSLRQPLAVWAVCFVMLWTLVSLIDAINPMRGWWWTKHMFGYTGMFLFLYILRSRQWYLNMVWLILIPLTFNSALGIAQFMDVTDGKIATFLPFWEHIGFLDYFKQAAPPGGTFSNKNLAASYLVLVLPVALYQLFKSRSWQGITLSAVILAMGTTFLIYTRSRGSWVAAVATVIFFALWVLIHKPSRQLLYSYLNKLHLAALAAVVLVVAAASTVESPLKGFHSIDKTVGEQAASIAQLQYGDIGVRLAYNLNTLHMVLDNPINGVGIGSFHMAYPKYHNAAMPTPPAGYGIEARPQRTHNDLLQAFAEQGIPGGLGYVAMFLSLLMMSWRIIGTATKQQADTDTRLLTLFTMTGMIGLSINSLGDFPLQMATAPGYLWGLLGVITGIYMLLVPNPWLPGRQKAVALTPRGAGVATSIAAVCFLAIGYESSLRRDSDRYLKVVMGHVQVNNYSDAVLAHMDKAASIYSFNARLQEYLATVYTNYNGSRPIPLEDRIAKLEYAVQYDPYTPNLLVNLGGMYYRLANRYIRAGSQDLAKPFADRVIEIYREAIKTAPFAPHPFALGGVGFLMQQKPNKSIALFNKALEIEPNYPPAVSGREFAINELRRQGYTEEQIAILDGTQTGSINIGQQIRDALEEKGFDTKVLEEKLNQ